MAPLAPPGYAYVWDPIDSRPFSRVTMALN